MKEVCWVFGQDAKILFGQLEEKEEVEKECIVFPMEIHREERSQLMNSKVKVSVPSKRENHWSFKGLGEASWVTLKMKGVLIKRRVLRNLLLKRISKEFT